MKIEVRYSWRYKWAGRTITSKIKLTEEQARKQDLEAVRLDHTREDFLIRDQPCEIDHATVTSMGRGIGTNQPWLSRLYRPKTLAEEDDCVPLPMTNDHYSVSCEGDMWTVTANTVDFPPRVVYRGRGPVRVEVAP